MTDGKIKISQLRKYVGEMSCVVLKLHKKKPEAGSYVEGVFEELEYIETTKEIFTILLTAVEMEEKDIYFQYLKWNSDLSKNRNITLEYMVNLFISLKETLEIYTSRMEKIEELFLLIDEGTLYFADLYENNHEKIDCETTKSTDRPFVNYLLDYEKEKAIDYVEELIKEGTSIKEIYLDVFQPALYIVGDLWQKQCISVAKEHYCTAVIQQIIASLYPRIFENTLGKSRKMIAVCAGEELHEIGIRMVADFFEMDGWNTYYLGANVPVKEVIKEMEKNVVDVIAISATFSTNLMYVEELIRNIRKNSFLNHTKIFVGGKVFNDTNGLWKIVKADGFGRNALETIEKANSFF